MNLSDVIYKLRSYFDDSEINTFILGQEENVDVYKSNIFPMVHMFYQNSNVTMNTTSFTFLIGCLDIRMVTNSPVVDKFEGNDNMIDNLNFTHDVMRKFLFRLMDNKDGVDLTSENTIESIYVAHSNGLDGHSLVVTVEVGNYDKGIC